MGIERRKALRLLSQLSRKTSNLVLPRTGEQKCVRPVFYAGRGRDNKGQEALT